MSKYKVKFFNHISDSDYTLDQAKERVEYLNSTFKGCNAHIVEMIEIYGNKEIIIYEYDEDIYYVYFKNEESKNYFADEEQVRNIIEAETKYA